MPRLPILSRYQGPHHRARLLDRLAGRKVGQYCPDDHRVRFHNGIAALHWVMTLRILAIGRRTGRRGSPPPHHRATGDVSTLAKLSFAALLELQPTNPGAPSSVRAVATALVPGLGDSRESPPVVERQDGP